MTALPPSEQRLRQARRATLTALGLGLSSALFMPGVCLLREPRTEWIVLGGLGIGIFAVALLGAVYLAVTPWLPDRTRKLLLAGFVGAALLSVFLVGPLADGQFSGWAWIGAAIVGTAPLLAQRWSLALIVAASVATAAGVAWWVGGSVGHYVLITGGIGISIATVSWLQIWFWDLLFHAQQGRAAQARLAATQERLRFARDVHDLLGHNLSVIALKAELASRLAEVDPARAGQEAAEVQRLAAGALAELREAVHGYRAVDLKDQITAVQEILRSSGVRCTVTQPEEDVPPASAALLASVLREATTNVLRHSVAAWCQIAVSKRDNAFALSVSNDGANGTGPDRHSFGLRGLADRLAEAGGRLKTRNDNGVFTLEAVVGETA